MKMKLKRYTDEERRGIGSACYDCRLPYDDIGWADLIVPDIVWEEINPTHHKGAGLLCCNCTIRRLVVAGFVGNVAFQFTSGPFAFFIRHSEMNP